MPRKCQYCQEADATHLLTLTAPDGMERTRLLCFDCAFARASRQSASLVTVDKLA